MAFQQVIFKRNYPLLSKFLSQKGFNAISSLWTEDKPHTVWSAPICIQLQKNHFLIIIKKNSIIMLIITSFLILHSRKQRSNTLKREPQNLNIKQLSR